MEKQPVKLIAGIEMDGKLVRDFTLRPLLVSDSVEAYDDPRARTNTVYLGAALMARRIEPEVTTFQVLGMLDSDYRVLMEADEALSARLSAGFRGKGGASPDGAGPA